MQLNYRLLILLLLLGHFLSAQVPSLQKQVHRIDSLILYTHFKEADEEVDRIHNVLSKSSNESKYRDLKVAVMLQKADIHILKEEYTKAMEIVLRVVDLAQEYHLSQTEFKACLMAALIYEISEHYSLCKTYLERAYGLYKRDNLENLYSTYCIRKSSFYRLTKNRDSALYYTNKGLRYARQYLNRRDLSDAYILLSILLDDINYREGIKFASIAAKEFEERNDFNAVSSMHNNICWSYQKQKEYTKAFLHNDTALWFCKKYALANAEYAMIYKHRYRIFDALGNRDSAFFYFKEYHNFYLKVLQDQQTTEIKNVTERYQSDKKESLLKSKDQQIVFIITILAVIATASILLIRKNSKINFQNKVIRKQVEELMKMLEQKQMLLSELQHRVKNNLQHVISILEIQKESVDFNNIDELIRGNQNRIHSIALLHKKLNVSENVNEVDLEKYIIELSELVKNSYDIERKKISLIVACEIDKMFIEKALPIGLIIVELVSNSMKHAFTKQNIGTVRISLSVNEKTGKTTLYYADNGLGFDFNKTTEKGLGMEIVKGLMGQLDAIAESRYTNGFELTIRF